MQQLINGVEDCIAKQNWFGALFIAISLPDICGATEGVIKGNGARYKDWFNRYLKPKYDSDSSYDFISFHSPESLEFLSEHIISEMKEKKPVVAFSAEDCWSLRNACLHEGVDVSKLRKFKITSPPRSGAKIHMNVMDGVLQLDVVEFCKDVVEGVRKWQSDIQDSPELSKKMSELMKIDHLILERIIGFDGR